MSSATGKIKKISADGVPYTADAGKSRNPSSVFAVVQHEPTIIRGESGHPILSGVEHNYVNKSWNRPTNVQAYRGSMWKHDVRNLRRVFTGGRYK